MSEDSKPDFSWTTNRESLNFALADALAKRKTEIQLGDVKMSRMKGEGDERPRYYWSR